MLVGVQDTLRLERKLPWRFPHFRLISHSLVVKRALVTFFQAHDVNLPSYHYLIFTSSDSPTTRHLVLRHFLWNSGGQYPTVLFCASWSIEVVARDLSF